MMSKILKQVSRSAAALNFQHVGQPKSPNLHRIISMSAAIAMQAASTAGASSSSRFVAKHHHHQLGFCSSSNVSIGRRFAAGNHRSRGSRSLVSTSRTTTVIPTTGIELENAGLELDFAQDTGNINGSSGGNDGGDGGRGRGGDGKGGGGHNGWSGGAEDSGDSAKNFLFGLWGAFIRGWRARVRTDPQFPFKVLTEEFIGVGACVLGDMATRPNFGLNELDFVFSTVVVGSILNFTLMFMLAPTSAGAEISRLPHIFASCPPGYMFEPGAYTFFERFGTFVYKGLLFAGAGFVAGIIGTAISTMLLNARKKVDPSFKLQNEAPPVLLNAATWALHMGLSSNLRYQALNGVEYLAAGVLSPSTFKAMVFALRAANNVLGGTSFVLLARLTGSQRSSAAASSTVSSGKKKNGDGEEEDLAEPLLLNPKEEAVRIQPGAESDAEKTEAEATRATRV